MGRCYWTEGGRWCTNPTRPGERWCDEHWPKVKEIFEKQEREFALMRWVDRACRWPDSGPGEELLGLIETDDGEKM